MTGSAASRWRDLRVVVLTLSTGAVDAACYLRLGHVFSSVITGNLVLVGVAAGQQTGPLALNCGLAVGGYGAGVLVGGAFAGTPQRGQPAWPRQVTVTLIVEFVLLTGFSAGWLAADGHPSGVGRLGVLVLAACAMGVQSTAVRRLGPMSTTYLTSTMTGLLTAVAIRRWPAEWRRSTGVLAAVMAGAACGALATAWAPALLPVIVLAPVAGVGLTSLALHQWPGNVS
jgi:uncharacterized membrane protein YoaK (UPF0700 family)